MEKPTTLTMKHLLFLLLLSASILAAADQVALRVCPPLEMPPVNTKERPKNRPVIIDLPDVLGLNDAEPLSP